MTTTNGIPPISDYAHWNEDAERVWYEENKYDMLHPEVFEDYLNDPYDERNYDYSEEIPEAKCWQLNRHSQNTSGNTVLFGPNADLIVYSSEYCDDCGANLVSDWVPQGYRVTKEPMIVYREKFTQAGRRSMWTDQSQFAVYEKIA